MTLDNLQLDSGPRITLETAMSSVPKNVVSAVFAPPVGNCMKRTVSGVVLKFAFGTLINGTPAADTPYLLTLDLSIVA